MSTEQSNLSETALSSEDVFRRRFVFIMGADRSGTTWLQAMVGSHPDVATTVQMTVFHAYIPLWLHEWTVESKYLANPDHWDMGLPAIWTREEFDAFLRAFIASVYTKVIEKSPHATHVLDKHPAYRDRVELILQFIPNARLIHVIRDGRDVALSSIAASRTLQWGHRSVDEAGRGWVRDIQAARVGQKYPDQYLEVRYEDLHAQCGETLQRVFEFCDLPLENCDVDRIADEHRYDKMKSELSSPDSSRSAPSGHYRKGISGGWREEMSAFDRYCMDRQAGDLLCELGYAEPGWVRMLPWQRITFPARYWLGRFLWRSRCAARGFIRSN